MRQVLVLLVSTVLAVACGGRAAVDENGGGSAKVTIAEKAFNVSNVQLTYDTGEDGYFRIDGDDAANPDKDCVPGLSSGFALYGDLPEGVKSLADLAGKELPFEFSGDGDDANLCFAGLNGLLGVEQGTVRFNKVDGTKIAFSFSGSFVLYDGEGGQSSTPVSASGSGTAHAVAQ